MPQTVQQDGVVRFGVFEADLRSGELRKNGIKVKIQELPFRALTLFVNHPNEVLSRDDLRKVLWPDGTFVDFAHGINSTMNRLRDALGDSADNPVFVETVERRGYRWIAPIRKPEQVVEVTPISEPKPATPAPAMPVRPADPVSLWRSRPVWVLPILVLLLAIWGFRSSHRAAKANTTPGTEPIRSVAVLPLQNFSNDSSQEYFVDGMTDELITDLAQIRDLKVVSRTSIMQYKGTRLPLPQIGRELGVDAIVEGSVLRSGDKVRITAQLIRSATDRHIWAKSYDGDLKDVLSLQARVAEAITNEVKINLTSDENQRLQTGRAVNPEAFDLYLRGRYAWNQRTIAGYRTAVDFFNQAIQKDPAFALAYSGLADCRTLLGLNDGGRASIVQAKEAAERAIALDDSIAEAHTSLAATKILLDWDWQGAEREFQHAIQLNPNSAHAHHWYSDLLLSPQGRHDEAIAEINRARELDPLSMIIAADTGFAYYLAGKSDLAFQWYEKVATEHPDFEPVHFYLIKYYSQTGQYDLAIKEDVTATRLAGAQHRADLIQRAFDQGGYQAVVEMGTGLRKGPDGSLVHYDPCNRATSFMALGQVNHVIDNLEICYREGQLHPLYLKVDPVWAPLHSEPRYQHLLQQINLQ